MTATQLTIDMLADSEADALARVDYLETVVSDLTMILGDLVFDRAQFETLARGWLLELAAARASNQRLHDELQRYTQRHVEAV